MLSDSQLDALRRDLEGLQLELREGMHDSSARAAAVELDQTRVGRLSRMDAIQQQQMIDAGRRGRQLRLQQVDGALRRLAEGDYGACLGCGEELTFSRLKARPETLFCVPCQNRREESRADRF